MIDEAMLLREIAYNLSGQDTQEAKAVMEAAASKIDELRSMLAGRDAEIGLLNSTLESRNRNIETLSEVSTAQRKVLEQALEALRLPSMKTESMLRQRDQTIAAIEEALK